MEHPKPKLVDLSFTYTSNLPIFAESSFLPKRSWARQVLAGQGRAWRYWIELEGGLWPRNPSKAQSSIYYVHGAFGLIISPKP